MLNKLFTLFFIIGCFFFIEGQSFAAVAPNNCYMAENYLGDLLTKLQYQTATILPNAPVKVHFYLGEFTTNGYRFPNDIIKPEEYIKGCPAVTAHCQSKAYLTPGDTVIIVKHYKEFSCAWYRNSSNETYGWLPNKFLKRSPATSPIPLQDWLGTWVIGETKITFTKAKHPNQLKMSGLAVWGRGVGQNIGELGENIITINSNKALYTNQGCQIHFQLINHDYLYVDDNLGERCGFGANVNFTALYTKN
jgi:hypothetical protein